MPCPCSTRCSAAAVAALEAAGVRRPGDQTERALPIPGVHRVDAQPELAGEVPAYGALAPRAGLPGQRGQQASRVPDGSPAPAIHAGQRVHLPAVTGADLHVERGAGRPAASTRATTAPRGSGWSRSRRYPPCPPCAQPIRTASNLARGSGSMSLEVVGEHVPDRPAGPVMVDVGDGVASGQQMAGELPVALGVGRRDHEIAAQEADRVLHASLLPSAGGVAEPDLDPVMLAEQLKHLHHTDSVPRDPVRGACGVVEHHQRRDHGRCARRSPAAPRIRTPRSPRAGPRRTACSNAGTRRPGQCTVDSAPPITASAWPKSTCMVPGLHSSSMNRRPAAGDPPASASRNAAPWNTSR